MCRVFINICVINVIFSAVDGGMDDENLLFIGFCCFPPMNWMHLWSAVEVLLSVFRIQFEVLFIKCERLSSAIHCAQEPGTCDCH